MVIKKDKLFFIFATTVHCIYNINPLANMQSYHLWALGKYINRILFSQL